jgi:predicted RNase H-like nuclease (RuvC/YqgF family)
VPPNPTVVKKLNDDIEQLKKLCKELNAAGADEVCTPTLRKKCASGQHGLKDNATNKQVREGLEERIDQLKRDLAKENLKK